MLLLATFSFNQNLRSKERACRLTGKPFSLSSKGYYLTKFLLMTILTKTFLSLMSCHFMALTFLSAGHV
jgi:hypothetical protein